MDIIEIIGTEGALARPKGSLFRDIYIVVYLHKHYIAYILYPMHVHILFLSYYITARGGPGSGPLNRRDASAPQVDPRLAPGSPGSVGPPAPEMEPGEPVVHKIWISGSGSWRIHTVDNINLATPGSQSIINNMFFNHRRQNT